MLSHFFYVEIVFMKWQMCFKLYCRIRDRKNFRSGGQSNLSLKKNAAVALFVRGQWATAAVLEGKFW